jgi:hypothetical protein
MSDFRLVLKRWLVYVELIQAVLAEDLVQSQLLALLTKLNVYKQTVKISAIAAHQS